MSEDPDGPDLSDGIPDHSKMIEWEDQRGVAREARRLSGAEFFERMRRGKIPKPPFAELLGIDLFDAGEGRFVMTLTPQEVHYNPMGCVHGGILATLLDSVMSAAVHTSLPAGRGYLTTEITIDFLRPVFEQSGEIMAEGRLLKMDHDSATAEGHIVDSLNEVCAKGRATCHLYDSRTPPRPMRVPPKASQ
jgi:uncharacterized protein (TIGR00369 family)